MKIEFLDADQTRARVTRGILWWKQQAYVFRYSDTHYTWWFSATNKPVFETEPELADRLDRRINPRDAKREPPATESPWERVL